MTSGPGVPALPPPHRVAFSAEERDALLRHVADVAGICAWVAFLAGATPRPPISFDAGVLLQIDLDSEESRSEVELALSKTGRETFGWLGERLADTEQSHPERTALVAQACERVLSGGVR